SCARRSSTLRSSGENSPRENWPASIATELGGGSDIAVRRRRYGLSAPAEDERAAAALHSALVDLGPECDEVVNGRYQGHAHHKPDCKICNPVNGKKVVAVDRPFLPAVVEDDRHHGND